MLRLIAPLMLILAALLGLVGQGVAQARAPLATMEMSEPMVGSMNCMEDMAQHDATGEDGCTMADCIAAIMASCGAAVIPHPISAMPVGAVQAILAKLTIRQLPGVSTPPDLRPPNLI